MFITAPDGFELASLSAMPLGTFREAEGLTVILTAEQAESAGLRPPGSCDGLYKCITLHVHSSLDAVGLTAAVSKCLAGNEIPANVVAAAFHDHIFVPESRSLEAVSLLKNLSSSVVNPLPCPPPSSSAIDNNPSSAAAAAADDDDDDSFEPRQLICIGDLHGNIIALKQLWFNLASEIGVVELNRAVIVFLGDYVDRGPDSKRILDWLVDLKNERTASIFPDCGPVHFICGNHDFAFGSFIDAVPIGTKVSKNTLDKLRKPGASTQPFPFDIPGTGMHLQGRRWGGSYVYNAEFTYSSYDAGDFEFTESARTSLMQSVPDEHKEFLMNLDWVAEIDLPQYFGKSYDGPEKLICVHAGLNPAVPAEEQLIALRNRDLLSSAILTEGDPTRIAPLSNRSDVSKMHADLEGRAILVSGHHGYLHEDGDRYIIDLSGGIPTKDRPLCALILPDRKIIGSSDVPSRHLVGDVKTKFVEKNRSKQLWESKVYG